MPNITINVILPPADPSSRAKELEESFTISVMTTVLQLSGLLKERLSAGGHKLNQSQQFGLYETEFIKPETGDDGTGRRKSPDMIHKRYIRALGPDEYPLAVQHGWKFLKNAIHYTFYFKEKDPESSSFAALRKELCRSLPADVLRRRLQEIEQDQILAQQSLMKRYQRQKESILQKMSNLTPPHVM